MLPIAQLLAKLDDIILVSVRLVVAAEEGCKGTLRRGQLPSIVERVRFARQDGIAAIAQWSCTREVAPI